MKTKLTLLAAVILAGIGSSVALADPHATTPAGDQHASMKCCAMGQKASAPAADKSAPATTGMSCHPDAGAAKEAAPVKSKSCCK